MKLLMLNMHSGTRFFTLLIIFCLSGTVLAESCEPIEGNEYEKILCALKHKGRGAGLPNIYEFRKNTPLTQAFLLKKPAERAGITIKIPERNNQETLRRQEEILIASLESAQTTEAVPTSVSTQASTQAATQAESSAVIPVTTTSTTPQQSVGNVKIAPTTTATTNSVDVVQSVSPEIVADGLKNCSLQQLAIDCVGGRYQLVGNKTNQQLSDNALSDEHKLNLPVYTGSADDVKAIEDYLAKAYGRYVDGMMEIGLGASTMSYTKFVNLHHYIVGQHLDFAGRFETMYQFLKKDKAAIGVSTKLSIAEGLTPEYCSQLENFIACDYKKNNYIFIKQSP